MKLCFEVVPHLLRFRFEAGTSRGTFTEKETWFIKACDAAYPSVVGVGEASPLKGLSPDYSTDYEQQLRQLLSKVEGSELPGNEIEIMDFAQSIFADKPSMRFGLETALLDLLHGGIRKIFNSEFFRGRYNIPINGLVWMGDAAFMESQIEEKLKDGFNTIKMKVGAIDFDRELSLLEGIRCHYSAGEVILRVDANGAFHPNEAIEKITQLAALDIHSIEQPIRPRQTKAMKTLCESGILPVALDEELIGIQSIKEKKTLISTLKPQFLILKPALLGGFKTCREWIEIAAEQKTGWWLTSMLESNIGLNAIAQFTAQYYPEIAQGLGTGQLFHNNVSSPLEIRKGSLSYNPLLDWGTQ